jgi:hypothetical protein
MRPCNVATSPVPITGRAARSITVAGERDPLVWFVPGVFLFFLVLGLVLRFVL